VESRHFAFLCEGLRSDPRQDTVRTLLERRWVQAILAATAVLTVIGTVSYERPTEALAEAAPTVIAPLLPVDVPGAETVAEAWRKRAVERESQRLAQEYVGKGYRVSPQLARNIGEAALKYDIDPTIAFGLVRAESSFRNSATSPVGAVGLTQLMPRTAAWIEPGLTRAELRDPRRNLEIGFKYLRYLIDKYEGDTRLALLAYNRGPGTVDRALRNGRNPDNGYVDFVMGEPNHGHKLFTRQRR
jgi:soluble lytic murein transglycosylase-like protein